MLSGSAKSSAGILIALLSAATFATAGPFAKSLLETGWTPGSVVFLRIAGAALLLLVPTVRALGGRWHLLRREWRQVVAYGLTAVALPQVAFFYAISHLSVGVALLLEYLALVLVVVWQSVVSRRAPRAYDGARGGARPDRAGARARRVRRRAHRRHRRGLGPARGARPGVVLPDVRQHARDAHCRRSTLAGGGLVVGGGHVRRARAHRRAADGVPHRAGRAGRDLAARGGSPSSSWPRSRRPRRTSPASSRRACSAPSWPRSSGLSEVLFAVLLAWVLLGELPRAIQLVGGLFILAGVAVVRAEESRPVRIGGRDSSGAGSATEANLAVAVPLCGHGPIVADDRVQGDGVDVPAAENHRRVVGAVQEQGPL